MVHTCVRCELRFANEAELEEHMEIDHHADPAEFDRFHYKAKPERPTGKRYLVLANRTLDDDATFGQLEALAKQGAHFHIVVPPDPAPGTDRTDDRGLALATFRLRHIVDRLHRAGVEAEGEVGSTDPIHAVGRALEHERADEIVVSVLPRGASKWIEVDLPAALHRRFDLPVTTLQAS
jgi:hypothetical protein